MKNVIINILKWCYRTKWTIGFCEQPLEEIVEPPTELEIHWLDYKYKKCWFADPFILDVTDDEIVVLVEEYYDPIKRGRISKLTVDRKTYKLKRKDVVLTKETHLSFPAIKRVNGRVFIYPENGASGQLTLYDFDIASNRCQLILNMCNVPLADAIQTSVFGEQQIFATEVPNHNGDTLFIYNHNTDGQYRKSGSIKFEGRKARNAGDWFKIGAQVYRPAQDCSQTYGGAVILQKVKKDHDGNLSFEDVKRIESNNEAYMQGCHTFNYFNGIAVIDAKGYKMPSVVKILSALSSIKKKLKK